MVILGADGRQSLRMAVTFFLKTSIILVFLSQRTEATRLYTEEDPVVILTSSTLKQTVQNSSTAWLVQFYSSWCGHCIQYSPTWKALAGDVQDWELAVRIGVLDCAHEDNFDVCKEFGIHFYPTFRYFKAHSLAQDFGKTYRGADRELQTVRHLMVNVLQNHTKLDRPDRCPPLDPVSSADILPLLGQKSDRYTAVIVENQDSYVGREVILDLMPYQGVTVQRALSSDSKLVERLSLDSFPSAYLLHPNGTHTLLDVRKRLRFFFSSFLRLLPGVLRQSSTLQGQGLVLQGAGGQDTDQKWRDFDNSKVYMADLESGLHYLLRVELATHLTLEGEELSTFKDFVTVVAKLFPGRQCVVKLLETLLEWLVSLPLEKIPYDAILDLVNNKMRISGLFLGEQLQWVGCQGSRAGLRGYPCSLWTLFHVLTVQAASRPDALANTGLEENPRAVLQTMRRYIVRFFGCQECGQHFDHMAKESLDQVQTGDQAVLWLWSKHNLVNNRLAGSMSEDPQFPKTPWPSPALCPSCHEERSGLHVWSEEQVLAFLKRHYGPDNISPQYTVSAQRPREPRPDPHPDPHLDPDPAQDADQPPEPVQEKAHQEKTPAPQASLSQAQARGGGGGAGAERVEAGSGGGGILSLGFSSVDMSLCVLLYACSCVFLMLMFFFFRVRSKRWKVRYNRPHV
ncbi:sulfhydryl oxidase 2 [Osmerus eperlanus]|uniref:sulfhydryl oxidase 2 n=1 Tax=Osmerus eperlanus TaxID=29151 RepID=UPI002E12E2B8